MRLTRKSYGDKLTVFTGGGWQIEVRPHTNARGYVGYIAQGRKGTGASSTAYGPTERDAAIALMRG